MGKGVLTVLWDISIVNSVWATVNGLNILNAKGQVVKMNYFLEEEKKPWTECFVALECFMPMIFSWVEKVILDYQLQHCKNNACEGTWLWCTLHNFVFHISPEVDRRHGSFTLLHSHSGGISSSGLPPLGSVSYKLFIAHTSQRGKVILTLDSFWRRA